jgi:hypothetical protein
MAFKVNYQQQRNDRNRAKQAKKEEKLRLRQEEAALRKGGADAPAADPVADGSEQKS